MPRATLIRPADLCRAARRGAHLIEPRTGRIAKVRLDGQAPPGRWVLDLRHPEAVHALMREHPAALGTRASSWLDRHHDAWRLNSGDQVLTFVPRDLHVCTCPSWRPPDSSGAVVTAATWQATRSRRPTSRRVSWASRRTGPFQGPHGTRRRPYTRSHGLSRTVRSARICLRMTEV